MPFQYSVTLGSIIKILKLIGYTFVCIYRSNNSFMTYVDIRLKFFTRFYTFLSDIYWMVMCFFLQIDKNSLQIDLKRTPVLCYILTAGIWILKPYQPNLGCRGRASGNGPEIELDQVITIKIFKNITENIKKSVTFNSHTIVHRKFKNDLYLFFKCKKLKSVCLSLTEKSHRLNSRTCYLALGDEGNT